MKKTHKAKVRLAMLNHKGFTLVEVLIALLVLGILFVPVSNAFLQSVHVNQRLQQRVTAVRETQTAMEVTLSLLNTVDSTEKAVHVEPAKQIDEQINNLLADFDSFKLIKNDITVEIAPLHQDSPFFLITATSIDTNTKAKGAADNFTLTTLRLPGEAPWLAPTEYRVVTP